MIRHGRHHDERTARDHDEMEPRPVRVAGVISAIVSLAFAAFAIFMFTK